MRQYWVEFFDSSGAVQRVLLYNCADEMDALNGLARHMGQEASERVISIRPSELCSPDLTPHDHEVFESFLGRVENQDRAAFIRAEVEAMDWPEVVAE